MSHAQAEEGKFFAETIDYLGHISRPGDLQPAGRSTDAVENWNNLRRRRNYALF